MGQCEQATKSSNRQADLCQAKHEGARLFSRRIGGPETGTTHDVRLGLGQLPTEQAKQHPRAHTYRQKVSSSFKKEGKYLSYRDWQEGRLIESPICRNRKTA